MRCLGFLCTGMELAGKPASKQLIAYSFKLRSSTYNHGQKSWDKFTFVALFHTRQTNSSTLVQPLPPSPSYNVGHAYTLFLQSFNILLGGGVGGEEEHILKRITVLF